MPDLETTIKLFCKENAGKKDIDFKTFKNPHKFHNEFGGALAYNKFKGEIFEKLLAELFRGNEWIVDRLGERGSDSGVRKLMPALSFYGYRIHKKTGEKLPSSSYYPIVLRQQQTLPPCFNPILKSGYTHRNTSFLPLMEA